MGPISCQKTDVFGGLVSCGNRTTYVVLNLLKALHPSFSNAFPCPTVMDQTVSLREEFSQNVSLFNETDLLKARPDFRFKFLFNAYQSGFRPDRMERGFGDCTAWVKHMHWFDLLLHRGILRRVIYQLLKPDFAECRITSVHPHRQFS